MIARDGLPWIVTAAVATAVLLVFQLWLPAGVLLGATAFFLNFFRDPERAPADEDPRGAVSPADGRVVIAGAIPGDAPPGAAGLPLVVSIFMNVFDVHVNRSPLAGIVQEIDHRGGLKLPADRDRARLENERNLVRLETPFGPLAFVQVAGLVARRIVFRKRIGNSVNRGERVGMIKFGSRVDVYLPPGSEILVAVGARTVAGETVIARLPREAVAEPAAAVAPEPEA